MVNVIEINVNDRSLFNRINNIKVKLPKEIGDAGFDFVKNVQRNLRLRLTLNKTMWRGTAWNSIKAKRVTNAKSQVTMSQRAIWLDNMKPHWVKLKKGRLIRQWALEKGKDNIKRLATSQRSIFVKPHQFIDAGYSRSLLNLTNIIKRHVDKAIV